MPDSAELDPTGSAVWSQPAEWERRRRPDGCIICTSGRPADVIADLASCWVTAPRRAPLAGYVCVVAHRHVVEPFELSAEEQGQFWRDSMLVARAVAAVTSPIKMNYELHGNTLPHLHLHVYPRQPDDPYVGRPIDPSRSSVARTDDELAALAAAIRTVFSE
jgi:diadenosine tetraphosphate (Ap4A) HIT family hydrolase